MAVGRFADRLSMTRITTRFVLLVATAAVAPLLIFGLVSVHSLRVGTQQSVIAGNRNVAAMAAEQIELYIANAVMSLQTVGTQLQGTRLVSWQQERILKNYVLEFPEFEELTLFDVSAQAVATSRIGSPTLTVPSSVRRAGQRSLYIAPVVLDEVSLPTTVLSIALTSAQRESGWLVAQLNLEELWRMVDRIRVGDEGFALLVTERGRLIAHGDPDEKPRIARGEFLLDHPLIAASPELAPEFGAGSTDGPQLVSSGGPPAQAEYANSQGRTMLGVAAPVSSLGWTIIVEQPTDEAYALATQLVRQLAVVITLALLVTVVSGYFWGRSVIRPIFALRRGTQAIAVGRLDTRVRIPGNDEFHQLGEDFNRMAGRLVELQDDVRKRERQAMFGRIAAGLVHDLSHPLQNIANSCKLILKMSDDRDYRATFERTVDREYSTLRRVLDDLRQLARPRPIERCPIDVNRSIADIVESMSGVADSAGVALKADLSGPLPSIEGDLFALGRVYRNLIQNAIEATAPGGVVRVSTRALADHVEITVTDTGCGIPADRLGVIFEDFRTTKSRGLGLGLAVSSRIVEQLDGTMAATSEVGKGTTIGITFPCLPAESPVAAAVN